MTAKTPEPITTFVEEFGMQIGIPTVTITINDRRYSTSFDDYMTLVEGINRDAGRFAYQKSAGLGATIDTAKQAGMGALVEAMMQGLAIDNQETRKAELKPFGLSLGQVNDVDMFCDASAGLRDGDKTTVALRINKHLFVMTGVKFREFARAMAQQGVKFGMLDLPVPSGGAANN